MRTQYISIFLLILAACTTVEKANRKPQAVRSTNRNLTNVPSMLRGTVKQHVGLMGYADTYSDQYEPLVAAGYGLVVGLQGTGSSEIPPQVRAHMIADLAKRGIGESTRGWGDITPEELLNSPHTAVVIVEALIPQAASGRKPPRGGVRADHPSLRGTRFDAHIYAEPSSSTTSLEGGYLLPTLLRVGQLTTGKNQARDIAAVSGTVFINPFAEPDAVGEDSVKRTSGRILDGGEVMHNLPMRLILFEPSHTRVTLIQNSINRVFPEEVGQNGPTARGMNDEQIEIRIPPSWRNDIPTFMELMTHITVRIQNPEGIAMSVKRLLLADPSPRNADAAKWRWQAIGERSLAVIRDLYDYPETLPRNASLRAGGGLGDPMSVPHLLKLAKNQSSLGSRLEAIDLLEDMPDDPRISFGLRPLLNDFDLEVRLRTTEALIIRGDPIIQVFNIDDKFELVLVPSEKEMVYITQTGTPQIILMGSIEIDRPLTLQAWNNDLMIREASDDENVLEVRYRDSQRGATTIERITPDLATFTMFLAHKTTPDAPAPGLNLTYSRTIGAIHSLWKQQYLPADFKVEQDRLLAVIQRLASETSYVPRPDFEVKTEEEPEIPYFDFPTPSEAGMTDSES